MLKREFLKGKEFNLLEVFQKRFGGAVAAVTTHIHSNFALAIHRRLFRLVALLVFEAKLRMLRVFDALFPPSPVFRVRERRIVRVQLVQLAVYVIGRDARFGGGVTITTAAFHRSLGT